MYKLGHWTVDILVIRPHWYSTHDLGLIRATFRPTDLTRNRFKTVNDRSLWYRVKGLFTLPSILSGFLVFHVKGVATEQNGHMNRSFLSASCIRIIRCCSDQSLPSLTDLNITEGLINGEPRILIGHFFLSVLMTNSIKSTMIKAWKGFLLKWRFLF